MSGVGFAEKCPELGRDRTLRDSYHRRTADIPEIARSTKRNRGWPLLARTFQLRQVSAGHPPKIIHSLTRPVFGDSIMLQILSLICLLCARILH